MKLVTLKGRFSKECFRCEAEIKPGEQAQLVKGTGDAGKRKYYCEKCGDKMQR